MLDPSKPQPSVNASSSNSRAEIEKCCQRPGISTNFKSTIWIPSSFINLMTSFPVMSKVSPSRFEIQAQRSACRSSYLRSLTSKEYIKPPVKVSWWSMEFDPPLLKTAQFDISCLYSQRVIKCFATMRSKVAVNSLKPCLVPVLNPSWSSKYSYRPAKAYLSLKA